MKHMAHGIGCWKMLRPPASSTTATVVVTRLAIVPVARADGIEAAPALQRLTFNPCRTDRGSEDKVLSETGSRALADIRYLPIYTHQSVQRCDFPREVQSASGVLEREVRALVLYWGMDHLALIEEHLAAAERHVEDGERHVTLQREIVAKLEGNGSDTATARQLLSTFEEALAWHIVDRDRLIGEKINAAAKANKRIRQMRWSRQ
ncbi:hypothetical protein [Sinorhizobium terangae]|uniref:hypothetical protein n=1 Tax=Sinorhizobium terangae TaxID=110322 RepID=UPI0024B0BAD1|nr:hypothetical protein [Sinorhizobium terangae]WFU51141.1 hypothetical protein QA637_21340 [Sinorhizobium terangae]